MNSLVCKVIITILMLVCVLPVAFSKNGQAELDDFVSEFVFAISNYNTNWLDSKVDVTAFMDKVESNSNVKAFKKEGFKRGFADGVRKKLSLSVVAELKHHGGHATFLKYIKFDGDKRPIIRLDYPDGMMNYIIIEVVRDESGGYKFSDVFYAGTGQYFSQMMSRIVSLSVESGTGFLDKIRGKERFNAEMTETLAKIAKYRLSGDYQKAYDVLMSLPEEIKHKDSILQISFGLASSLGEDLYKKELNKTIEYSSSIEHKELLLVDYFFYKKEYKKGIEVIDLFEKKYVEDGAINLLRSNLQYLDGDLDGAIWSAIRCKALEPTYEDCYWNLLAFYAETKQFDEVVEQITILETDFGYAFDAEAMKSELIYSDFIKSRSYQEWRSD